MQLKLSVFIAIIMVLLNNFNLLSRPSVILCDQINVGDTQFLRQSKRFLVSSDALAQLSREDKNLIESIIDLYGVSRNTMVDFTCADENVASMSYGFLIDSPGALPFLSLSASWKQLPFKQKKFILAHEMAHFVLGHLEINHDEYITNLSKIDKPKTLACGEIGFSGMLLAAWFMYENRKKMSKYGWTFMSSVTAICTGMYGVTSVSLRRNQTREKEADIKAVTMLGDAQGGIAWLVDMSNKAYYVDQFFVDIFGLSTHPSPYARMCYLQEWQAQQNK